MTPQAGAPRFKTQFITRRRRVASIALHQDRYVVEAYQRHDDRPVDENNPALWSPLFNGTQEECDRYTANLHHHITPEMAERFDPRKDVRRKIEID
jgi:hypothetical protein